MRAGKQERRLAAPLSARCAAHASRPLSRGEFLFSCFQCSSAGAAETAPKSVTAHGACIPASWQVETHSANAPVFSPPASQPAQQSQQPCISHGLVRRVRVSRRAVFVSQTPFFPPALEAVYGAHGYVGVLEAAGEGCGRMYQGCLQSGLIPVCVCIFYMCTCGATALRLSYMPDCPYA